jgi:hypothetical protein
VNAPVLPASYPLAWPPHWQRTPAKQRAESAYRVTSAAAREDLERELALFTRAPGLTRPPKGLPRHVIITTNIPLRLDGRPLSSRTEPQDPGVAVWWIDAKRHELHTLACDAWSSVRANYRALSTTISAYRAIDRARASEVFARVVAASVPLSLPGTREWYEAELGLSVPYTREDVMRCFRARAKIAHPDSGGTTQDFVRLTQARDLALTFALDAAGAAQ